MARRIEGFEVTPETLPDILRPAWGLLRDYYRNVRTQQREFSKKFAELRANSDLTAEARQRREAELREELKKAIDPLWEATLAEREKARVEVARIIDREANADPFAAPEVRFSELDAAGTELARLSLAQHEQTGRVAQLLVDGRVDEMISRALARDTDKSGGPLLSLYETLTEESDPLVLRAFERAAPRRLRAEGSSAVAEALSEIVEQAREARLPEAAKALLDHRDALDEATNYTVAVHGETATEEFLFGKSLALNLASQTIGSVFAGAEE